MGRIGRVGRWNVHSFKSKELPIHDLHEQGDHVPVRVDYDPVIGDVFVPAFNFVVVQLFILLFNPMILFDEPFIRIADRLDHCFDLSSK